tara:strand:- start:105 stop:392 length:288 start_codon:yes stop_codon:yes gene_type:complete
MLIKLVQLKKVNDFPSRYSLEEIFINPEHVVLLREDLQARDLLEENFLPEGLDKRQQFTRLLIDRDSSANYITIVGAPDTVSEKISHKNKQLLKG